MGCEVKEGQWNSGVNDSNKLRGLPNLRRWNSSQKVMNEQMIGMQ